MPDFSALAAGTSFIGLARDWLERESSSAPRVRYRTGFSTLDSAIGNGIEQASLVVVGGLTGAGKTPMLNALAVGLAKAGANVTLAALELGSDETRNRLIAREHGTSYDSFRSEFASGVVEYETMTEATLRVVDALPITLIDRPIASKRTIRSLFEDAWRAKAQVLVIDHARELDGWNMRALPSGYLGAEAVAMECAELTYRSRIACIIAQQLDARRVSRYERPSLEHLRDTQKLAELADLVIIPHRPHRGDPENDRVGELIVSKNRRGPEPLLHMGWHGPSMCFSSAPDLFAETDLARMCCGEDAPTVQRPKKARAR